jgi:hypothetical protein
MIVIRENIFALNNCIFLTEFGKDLDIIDRETKKMRIE